MQNVPDAPELIELLRNADEREIRQRLDELDGERDALKTLLRSVQARNRFRQNAATAGARGDV
jgi:hypothetical protein